MPKTVEGIWGAIASIGMAFAVFSLYREDRRQQMDMSGLIECPRCGVLTSNDKHECVEYDPNKPCPTCGAASVYCFAGAPGTGGAWTCQQGHVWDNTVRELTIEDVI